MQCFENLKRWIDNAGAKLTIFFCYWFPYECFRGYSPSECPILYSTYKDRTVHIGVLRFLSKI